ncbi:hypothetical protein SNEBB_010971 [Seison nebaliae]|nr:hypothetical protein SNEBB_010971 [Seison nebaliae]
MKILLCGVLIVYTYVSIALLDFIKTTEYIDDYRTLVLSIAVIVIISFMGLYLTYEAIREPEYKEISNDFIILIGHKKSSRSSTFQIAKRLFDYLRNEKEEFGVIRHLSDCSVEELLEIKTETSSPLKYYFVVTTWSDGLACEEWSQFFDELKEIFTDFRISREYLSQIQFAVVGLGDSTYTSNYNRVAINLRRYLRALGAQSFLPLKLLDVTTKDVEDFQMCDWMLELEKCDECDCNDSNDESEDENVDDIEDVTLEINDNNGDNKTKGSKKMLTDLMRNNLTKKNYKIVGDHSGVKLCRWTKAMLRGRGGCYKHTFYGIASHRCMEVTPSLACANKCVFCWRLHSNPVGTEWKWLIDDPNMLVENLRKEHIKMIKTFSGAPGVITDRLLEGYQPKHCALSLVGEPIMYPKINEFCRELYNRSISSYMVTNGQFPNQIKDLIPVTQLYVSVDAGNKETLKTVDRPLFSDFWERLIASLTILKSKKERTVYRLTLIKNSNMEEASSYANLVEIGQPDFIEIKGVTFCGTSKDVMTMKNVPWHDEVIRFASILVNEIAKKDISKTYELACEHAHSNCILIASTEFKIDGKWHTWIAYDKFINLVNKDDDFTGKEYSIETPEWALYGNGGFDPKETRFHRKGEEERNEQIRKRLMSSKENEDLI